MYGIPPLWLLFIGCGHFKRRRTRHCGLSEKGGFQEVVLSPIDETIEIETDHLSLKVDDKLTGSDLLVVSGDLILEPEQLGEFIDMHRLKR